MAFLRLEPLAHDLSRHFAELRAVRDRRALERSALWREIRGEVERVIGGVERGDVAPACAPAGARDARSARGLRLVAWNVQRGARFEALVEALGRDPVLSAGDVFLLTEIDCGLGRSRNRNVARELAERLGMSYRFGPSYLTLEDDFGENRARVENTTALAGTAILSRVAVRGEENVTLPELRDKFSSSERRLGCKRALIAEVEAPAGPLRVAACHLDSNASPRQRAAQLGAVLDRLEGATQAVVGGDFNSSTHDLSSPLATVRDALRKVVARGLRGTIDGYMTPDAGEERPIFELLARRGCRIDGFNDRARATYHYDFNDPYALEKLRRAGGPALVWIMRRLLRRWSGRLPARLDWFAGRGVHALSSTVVTPRDAEGRLISDHAAIVCDLQA